MDTYAQSVEDSSQIQPRCTGAGNLQPILLTSQWGLSKIDAMDTDWCENKEWSGEWKIAFVRTTHQIQMIRQMRAQRTNGRRGMSLSAAKGNNQPERRNDFKRTQGLETRGKETIGGRFQ